MVLEGESGVRADAGVSLNNLVRWTIGRGLAGLEAWAGTPGTVGGAVFGNAHYRGRSIGELVASVRLVGGERRDRGRAGGRDGVRLRSQPAAADGRGRAVGAVRADADGRSRRAARDGAAVAGRSQAHAAAATCRAPGCVFQNPDPAVDRVPDGIPASAGALIDRAGLKGVRDRRRAGVAAARQLHRERGRRDRIRHQALIERCRDEVRARFGVTLREEIRYLGEFAVAVADRDRGVSDVDTAD